MLRARLGQLRIIPFGVLLFAYEFGAASAPGDPSGLAAAVIQTDSLAAMDHRTSLAADKTDDRCFLYQKLTPLALASLVARAADLQFFSPVFATGAPSKPSSRISPAATAERSVEQNQPQESPSILQMIEGREQDALIGAGIAATFFLLGWIGGGSYYVRRERRRRTRLHF